MFVKSYGLWVRVYRRYLHEAVCDKCLL